MRCLSPLSLHALVCLGLACPAALADDFYVDVNSGSDANSGLTPATAWATITFALNNTPLASGTGTHTIHVAPGTYSTASGETFPLVASVPTAAGAVPIALVADAGSASTTLSSAGASAISIATFVDASTQTSYESRIGRVAGFGILTPSWGVTVFMGSSSLLQVELEDLRVQGQATGNGISFSAGAQAFGVLAASVVACEVSGFTHGLFLDTKAANAPVLVRDTHVHDNQDGVKVRSGPLTVENCRIVENAGWGVSETTPDFQSATAHVLVQGTLVQGNGLGGIEVYQGLDSDTDLDVCRSTITGNSGPGLEVFTIGNYGAVRVDTSILYFNPPDFSFPSSPVSALTIEFSNAGASNPSTSSTNIRANPMFVSVPNADYTLLSTSPCIDAGNPALGPDPDGSVADMGAFPFQETASPYCTGKTNSLGCVPFQAWAGLASASAAQPFAVSARDLLPSEAGFLLYSFKAGNLNFHGGKLCVKTPLTRLLPAKFAKATGTPPCSGVLTRNFNAHIQSGTDPLLTVGQSVFTQWRQRDPADPTGFGDSLTNGLSFLVAP